MSHRAYLHGVTQAALGTLVNPTVSNPGGTGPVVSAPRAAVTYTPGTAPGTGGAVVVAVVTPGASAPGAGTARAPADIGNSILVREASMTGVATSDKPCIDYWTVLLFDTPCERVFDLVYVEEYIEAQNGLAALAAEPEPVTALDRAVYVGLVGAYAWVMGWAAGVEGVCLPYSGAAFGGDVRTSPGWSAFSRYVNARDGSRQLSVIPTLTGGLGLGMARSVGSHPSGTGDLPITISQLNLNRCNPAVWSGARGDGGSPTGRTVIGSGADVSWGTDEGAARVAAARVVAGQLATYDLVRLWANAFDAYKRQVETWKAAGLPVDISATDGAQVTLALQAAHTWQDVKTAGETATAVMHPAPILAKIVGVILAIFTMLPAASGGVHCPSPFLYRSSKKPECSGSSDVAGGAAHVVETITPITVALVDAERARLASHERKSVTPSKSSSAPWIVGGAVGLGLLALLVFRRK